MRYKIQVLAILSLLAAVTLLGGISISPAKAIPIQGWRLYGMAKIDSQPAGAGLAVSAKSDSGTVYSNPCITTTSTTQNYSLYIRARSSDPVVVGAIDGEIIHLFIDTTEVATVQYKIPSEDPLPLELNKYTTTFSVSLATPSNLASNSVTLNATLNGLGSNGSATLTFEYGLTTSYGPPVTATPPSRTVAGSFSANLAGLASGQKYYYRAVATGQTAVFFAGDFTTTAPTLTVITGVASGITANSATLAGNLTDMGGNSSVNVSFVYGPSSTPTPNQLMNGPGYFSYLLPGLTAGTPYNFQAKAVGSTIVLGLPYSFTTTATTSGCTTMCCHRFWGTAYSGTTPAAGASIVAYANNVQKQTATANPSGVYNMQVPISGGETMTFTVNGAQASESTVGQCGGVNYNSQQRFDLYISSTLSITDTSPLTPAATVNVLFNRTFTATGGSGTGRTWTLSSQGTLPTAFTIGSTTGILTGTATAAGGPYTFTVQVNDSLGAPATKVFQLTVNAVGALSISDTSPLTPAATVNVLFNRTFTATGGSGTGRTWTLSSQGTLPVAFTIGSTTGILTGTATVAGGPYTFTVQVNDSLGTPYTKVFQLTVNAVSTLSISDTSPLTPAATVNVLFNRTFTATGGSGTGRTWTLSSQGTLPTAFTIGSTTGILTGTATAAGGPYSFTVQVNDSLGVPYTKVFLLTVGASPTPSCNNACIGSTSPALTGQPANVAFFALYKGSCTSINTIWVKAKGAGNVKVAIYEDISGSIGSLLGANNALTPVSLGDCNAVPIILTTTIDPGRYYWLAYWSDTYGVIGTGISPTETVKYMGTFANFNFDASTANARLNPGASGLVAAGN